MKTRDLVKKLKDGGYSLDRTNKHDIYEHPNPGRPPVQVPKGREVNEKTANRILKDAGLK